MNNTQATRKRETAADRVVAQLVQQIRTGDYSPGMLLPGRRALADEFRVSSLTIDRAIKKLTIDGVIRSEHGRGTFVNPTATSISSHGLAATQPSSPKSKQRVGIVSNLLSGRKGGYSNFWYHTVIEQFERILADAGCEFRYADLSYVQGTRSTMASLVQHLAYGGAQAIAVICEYTANDINEVLEVIDLKEHPVVFVGSRQVNAIVPVVYMDSHDAGVQAADHLIRNGCRRLLFFSPYSDEWVHRRCAGVRYAAVEAGLDERDVTVEIARLSYEELCDSSGYQEAAYQLAKTLLDRSSTMEGVVAANDESAYGFMRAAGDLGLTAGVDYAIVGFDNLRMSRALGLTSFAPQFDQMAVEIAQLIQRILLGERINLRVSLQMILQERASSQFRAGKSSGVNVVK